ncbi:MAG: hypothetical protein LBB38_02250 [Puniceicoccales bacterium]|jgi:hypothetical protein|nr:hypothetical protein [Puniceicoccales bacterium]
MGDPAVSRQQGSPEAAPAAAVVEQNELPKRYFDAVKEILNSGDLEKIAEFDPLPRVDSACDKFLVAIRSIALSPDSADSSSRLELHLVDSNDGKQIEYNGNLSPVILYLLSANTSVYFSDLDEPTRFSDFISPWYLCELIHGSLKLCAGIKSLPSGSHFSSATEIPLEAALNAANARAIEGVISLAKAMQSKGYGDESTRCMNVGTILLWMALLSGDDAIVSAVGQLRIPQADLDSLLNSDRRIDVLVGDASKSIDANGFLSRYLTFKPNARCGLGPELNDGVGENLKILARNSPALLGKLFSASADDVKKEWVELLTRMIIKEELTGSEIEKLLEALPVEFFGLLNRCAKTESGDVELPLFQHMFEHCSAKQLEAINPKWLEDVSCLGGYDAASKAARHRCRGVNEAYKSIPKNIVGSLTAPNGQARNYTVLHILAGVLTYGTAEQIAAITNEQLDALAEFKRDSFNALLNSIGTEISENSALSYEDKIGKDFAIRVSSLTNDHYNSAICKHLLRNCASRFLNAANDNYGIFMLRDSARLLEVISSIDFERLVIDDKSSKSCLAFAMVAIFGAQHSNDQRIKDKSAELIRQCVTGEQIAAVANAIESTSVPGSDFATAAVLTKAFGDFTIADMRKSIRGTEALSRYVAYIKDAKPAQNSGSAKLNEALTRRPVRTKHAGDSGLTSATSAARDTIDDNVAAIVTTYETKNQIAAHINQLVDIFFNAEQAAKYLRKAHIKPILDAIYAAGDRRFSDALDIVFSDGGPPVAIEVISDWIKSLNDVKTAGAKTPETAIGVFAYILANPSKKIKLNGQDVALFDIVLKKTINFTNAIELTLDQSYAQKLADNGLPSTAGELVAKLEAKRLQEIFATLPPLTAASVESNSRAAEFYAAAICKILESVNRHITFLEKHSEALPALLEIAYGSGLMPLAQLAECVRDCASRTIGEKMLSAALNIIKTADDNDLLSIVDQLNIENMPEHPPQKNDIINAACYHIVFSKPSLLKSVDDAPLTIISCLGNIAAGCDGEKTMADAIYELTDGDCAQFRQAVVEMLAEHAITPFVKPVMAAITASPAGDGSQQQPTGDQDASQPTSSSATKSAADFTLLAKLTAGTGRSGNILIAYQSPDDGGIDQATRVHIIAGTSTLKKLNLERYESGLAILRGAMDAAENGKSVAGYCIICIFIIFFFGFLFRTMREITWLVFSVLTMGQKAAEVAKVGLKIAGKRQEVTKKLPKPKPGITPDTKKEKPEEDTA